MNRSRPVHLILAFCCLFLPAVALQMPAAPAAEITPDKPAFDSAAYFPDNPDIPKGMMDLMKASQSKYLKGSNLIRAGESAEAQEAFNEAVDLLLQSDWDLASTPALRRFFQDLIQRIQEEESRYLLVPIDTEEETETAVVDELNKLDLIPITVDPALRDALASDLANTKYGIPITINDMVLKSLDYWLNGGRAYFVNGLQRSGQYRRIIEDVFCEESIPMDLIYLAQVESLFRPHAVSKAKAKGIWQFEKATAQRYGLKVTRDVDERSDPEKSTRAAARYLKDLFAMFKDWNLALAAYNCGEGKIQRLIKSTGLNDFWQLVDLRRKVPQETKNHVPLIQASVILGRNPEKYGFPTEMDPPLRYAKVSVSKPIDLRAAARVLNTSIDELKRLNPALRGLTTPANYPGFELKVPADNDSNIQEQLAALPRAKVKLPPEYDGRHKVRPGETLTKIAARYRVSVADLVKANNISPRKKLLAGVWLQVPSSRVSSKKASASKRGASASGPTSLAARKPKAKAKKGSQSAGSAKTQKGAGQPNGRAVSPGSQSGRKATQRQFASK